MVLRASRQWFINTDSLKEAALAALDKVGMIWIAIVMSILSLQVEIQPESAARGFLGVVTRRPYWCISRQRVRPMVVWTWRKG